MTSEVGILGMLMKKLQQEIAVVVKEHWQLDTREVDVSCPRELGHGDFTTNIALKVAARWGIPTSQVTGILVGELAQRPFIRKNFTNVIIAEPGFVNFFLSPQSIWRELSRGKYNPYRGRKVIVEYSAPNIAKPMHVGHLRSTIIGQALVNIYRALGARVVALNYLGDWGTQFGKLLVAYQKWGSKVQLKHTPIDEMLRIYVKFHKEAKIHPELEDEAKAAFKNLEQGNKKLLQTWKLFREYSLREFNDLYKRLGVKFDYYEGESQYQKSLRKVLNELVAKKIITINEDGSQVVIFDDEKITPMLVQKSDGASLYATRDLAALKARLKKYHPTEMLYVVANQQALYFDQLFTCVKLAGFSNPKVKLTHVKFGLVLGEEGKKMSTREGEIIKLEELLNKAVDLAWRTVEKKNPELGRREKAKVAEAVGVGAVKYNDLSQNRLTDITFNWRRMMSFEGNSGPYLQYTYVRLKSILRKAGKLKSLRFNADILIELDVNLLHKLIQYQDSLLRAAKENSPHLVANYLYELANLVNSYYHEAPVLKAVEPLRSLRLLLVQRTALVLKSGLEVLGIKVVERM